MAKQPNILWLIADQHRGQALSCAGDSNIQTPNLDAPARQGARFSRAYSNCPLCSPFRASLFTGQYATTHGVISNHRPLLPRQPVLAELLRDAGYHTSYMGKWHISGGCYGHHFVSPWFRPGWNEWLGWENSNSHFDFKYGIGSSPRPHRCTEYMTDFLTNQTVDWLQNRTTDRPWFHVMSTEPPHAPFEAPEEYMAMFRDTKLDLRANFPQDDGSIAKYQARMRGYYAMIKNIDDNVGRILAALDEQGLGDNTIICYFSDHGEMLGSHNKVEKCHPEEESCNIPMLVRGPGIASGLVSNALLGGVDLMPTTLSLAGVAAPDSVQGQDLAGLFRGKSNDGANTVYVQNEHVIFPERAETVWRNLRSDDWSLTWNLADGASRLHNVKDDPYELSNLIDSPQHEKFRREMEAAMRAKAMAIGDRFFERHDAFLKGNDWQFGNGMPQNSPSMPPDEEQDVRGDNGIVP